MAKIYYYELYFEPCKTMEYTSHNFSLFARSNKKYEGFVKEKDKPNKSISELEDLVRPEILDAVDDPQNWHLVWINPLTKEALASWVDAPTETIDIDKRRLNKKK